VLRSTTFPSLTRMENTRLGWSPSSWRTKEAAQQVDYADEEHLQTVLNAIRRQPPLVTSWEIEALRKQLREAATGRRFLLQGGDCAESFEDCQEELIKNRLKILLQMSVVLIYSLQMPVVRVGRFAGQYAKPRSKSLETRNGVSLPSYRGDNINNREFTPEARIPDPERLMEAYRYSAIQLNFVRALADGKFADIHNADYWDLGFAQQSPHIKSYQTIIGKIREALRFAETVADYLIGGLNRVDFYTSHEALHLPYEEVFTRKVPHSDSVYNLSTHLPWIGKRTLFNGSAHIEYMRGIRNPIGIKVSAEMAPSDLVSFLRYLNPLNDPGRITMITRMGSWLVNSCVRLTCPRSANVSTSERATSRTMGVNASSFFPTRASPTRLRPGEPRSARRLESRFCYRSSTSTPPGVSSKTRLFPRECTTRRRPRTSSGNSGSLSTES